MVGRGATRRAWPAGAAQNGQAAGLIGCRLKQKEGANEQAAEIIKAAEAKSDELVKNTKSELRLFAQQSVNALKTEITDLVCG